MGKAVNLRLKFISPFWMLGNLVTQLFSRDSVLSSEFSVLPITMIYLGQNDFSTERQPMRDPFKNNYKRLIREIKEFYGPEHPILCVSTKVDKLLFDFVRECVEECGYANVYYSGMFQAVHKDDDSELGADWHPNWKAHTKLAYALIPYFSTITGWEMQPAKPVE